MGVMRAYACNGALYHHCTILFDRFIYYITNISLNALRCVLQRHYKLKLCFTIIHLLISLLIIIIMIIGMISSRCCVMIYTNKNDSIISTST